MLEKPRRQTEISIHKDESTDRPVLRSVVRRLWDGSLSIVTPSG
jgi:hypothetical protein